MAIIKPEKFATALVVDIMKVESKSNNQYDLPFYFMGQVLKTNYAYEYPATLLPLGDSNGYQHLYLEGKGKPLSDTTQLNWLVKGKFYTMTSATNADDDLLFTRVGANDPEFNLRRDAAFILRRKDIDNTLFASVIEPHGRYSPISELSMNPNSNISEFKVLHDSKDYTAVRIEDNNGQESILFIVNRNISADKRHHLKINGQKYSWQGPYNLTSN
jgi:hypothetical protein